MQFSGTYKTNRHKIMHSYGGNDIETFHFDSGKAGKHLLVLSGIHAGTERIPTAATKTAIEMLKNTTLPLTSGKITIIPLCNPLALEQGKRFVDSNLNRVMCKHETPTDYEHYLANIITDYIDQADAVIDLHTQSTAGIPFVFNDFPRISGELASNLGVKTIVTGWPEAFQNNADLFNESDTSSYACAQNIPSVCVECGYNKDPLTAATALKAIIMAMKLYGLTTDVYASPRNHKTIRILEGVSMPENAEFIKNFSNFEVVKKGTPLIKQKDSAKILIAAEQDSILVLPKIWASAGMEAFFYGEAE
jgi:predicted deacylase